MKDLIPFKLLTPAEQGVILLAIHNGEYVEISSVQDTYTWTRVTILCKAGSLANDAIIRIKPIARVIYTSNAGFSNGEWSNEPTPNRPVKFIECLDGE